MRVCLRHNSILKIGHGLRDVLYISVTVRESWCLYKRAADSLGTAAADRTSEDGRLLLKSLHRVNGTLQKAHQVRALLPRVLHGLHIATVGLRLSGMLKAT